MTSLQSIKKFISAFFLIGLWRDVRIGLLQLNNLWGAINFGLHTKYVKYKLFWHCNIGSSNDLVDFLSIRSGGYA